MEHEEGEGYHPLRLHSFGDHHRHEFRAKASAFSASQPCLIQLELIPAVPLSGFRIFCDELLHIRRINAAAWVLILFFLMSVFIMLLIRFRAWVVDLMFFRAIFGC